jgi:TRAP transporter 4TM/12TM fusion protein
MKKTRLGKSDAVQENKEVFANGNGFDGDIVISEKAQKVLTDKTRQLTGKALLALNIICFSMTLFQLYAAGPGNLVANTLRAIHLGYGVSISFLMFPICKKAPKNRIALYDIALAVAGAISNLYLVVNLEALTERAGLLTTADFIMGLIMIITLLEAARRVVGPVLTGISIFFLIYTIYGQYFPSLISHRGVALSNLVRHMYLTLEGTYGVALGVSASFIFLFITMGAILTHMGTGEFLTDIALCAFGKQRGGPAKAAVVSSAFFGLISGSTIANICTTGTFTIPLMKKTGYSPYFAGSVEATASVGGQIMPPVMGAAAFIIAENLGISYISVCLAAFFPSVLYFSGIFFAVHQEAVRSGIEGLKDEDIPDIKEVRKRAYLVLPLIVILGLLIAGFSPAMAGFLAILLAIALSFLKPESRLTPKKLFYAFADGAKNALEVLIACATVGFIVGSFTLSGMGLKLAALVLEVGDGRLLITLVLTALASLVLGMGVPTTANYVMMAMITVPAVAAMGVVPIAAHLFCFYYGIISDLTPPVALGALAGAGLAGGDFWKTAINATKLACAAYVAPFFFVYHPQLLLGATPFEFEHLLNLLFAFTGILILSCALYSFVITKTKWYERILLFIAAFMTILPEILTSALGIGMFVLIIMVQRKRKDQLTNRTVTL